MEPLAQASSTTTEPPRQGRRSVGDLMREPVVGPLLRSRFCAVGCTVIGVTQVWSALAGVTVWQCPVPKVFGGPCPGCGLSRASAAMFRGDFAEMFHAHAFAPLFMIALAAFCVAAVLPAGPRDRFASGVTRLERRLPLAPILLLLLMAYWIFRLAGSLI